MTSIEKAIVGFAVLVLAACALAASFLPNEMQTILNNLHWTVTSGAATLLAWLGYRKADETKQPYKKWFFFGLCTYFVGQLCWVTQVYGHYKSFPAPSDLFYLAMGPCFIVGFVQALKTHLSPSKLFAFRTDALSFTTAILGFVLVSYLPKPTHVSTLQLLVLTAYPVGLLGAAAVSLLIVPHLRPKFMWPWVLLSMGLFIEGAIWMQWNLNELNGLNETNTLLNKLFSCADIMLGLGALGWHFEPSKSRSFQRYCRGLQKLIPLAAIAISAGTALLISIPNNPQLYAYYVTVTSTLATLVFSAVRQSILLRESEKLVRAQKVIAENERNYQHLMQFDPLTNLPNRWLIHTRLEQALINASINEAPVGLLFIDISHFKNINDSFGHIVGDQFLMEFAKKLQKAAVKNGSLGRMESDKFLLIIETNATEPEITPVVQSLINNINAPFMIEQHEFVADVNIGISLYPRDADNATDLTRNASAALHKAKQQGNNNYQFYTEALTQHAKQHMDWNVSLRKAIKNQEFYLLFQPIFSIVNGKPRIQAAEALVRWKKANGETVPPCDFIPYAEEVGLIFPIGEWVFQESCKALAHINKQLAEPIEMSINISAKQFRKQNLPEFIASTIKAHHINPKLITLEITETAIFDQEDEAIKTLHVLKSLGLPIALDDFGVGQSSLFKLKSLPIDKLKVDRAFLMNVPDSVADKEILRSIAHTAKILNLTMVVEGVETEAQLDFLHQIGCQGVQGYLLSKPIVADDLIKLIKQDATVRA